MSSVSVTEVRNALRCPRIFALGRSRAQPVRFVVGSSSLGAAFHRIVDRFAQTVATPPDDFAVLEATTPREQVEASLRRWLMTQLAGELEAIPSLASMPAEVDDLAEALRELGSYLATHATGGPFTPEEKLQAFLPDSEVALEHLVELEGGDSILLRGRIDALHEPEAQHAQVVEYKLSGEENAELDRAQVALYRYLLRQVAGVDATPVVLRLTPQLHETVIAKEEADALVEKRLLPLVASMSAWSTEPAKAPPTKRSDLCPVCPVRSACVEEYPAWLAQRDQPPSGALRPRPQPSGGETTVASKTTLPPAKSDAGGEELAEKTRKWIVDILRKQGVPAESKKPPIVGARVITIEVTGKRSIRKIDRGSEDVIHQLAAEHDLDATYAKRKGRRLFQVVRRKPRVVELPALLARESEWLRESSGRFVLGEGTAGDVVVGDLGDPNCCHLLVGGSSGSGKSVLLRAVAASLVHFHSPATMQLTLVDPKRVTFRSLEASLGSHLAHPIVYEVEAALSILGDLVDLMEERYALLDEANVQDLGEFNDETPKAPMARHVVIIDEFMDLTVTKETKQPFLAAIQRLGAKARAAGIHLVLATQRPDVKAVPGVIKANLPGRVALRVPSGTNSRIIIEQKGAETLLGKGDLLADLGGGVVRAQAPLV